MSSLAAWKFQLVEIAQLMPCTQPLVDSVKTLSSSCVKYSLKDYSLHRISPINATLSVKKNDSTPFHDVFKKKKKS
jgi:hypothetical protein